MSNAYLFKSQKITKMQYSGPENGIAEHGRNQNLL